MVKRNVSISLATVLLAGCIQVLPTSQPISVPPAGHSQSVVPPEQVPPQVVEPEALTGEGTIELNIRWPKRDDANFQAQAIPISTNALIVTVAKGDEILDRATVKRNPGASTATLSLTLKASNNLSIDVKAYRELNPDPSTAIPIAQGKVTGLTVTRSKATAANIALDALFAPTIDSMSSIVGAVGDTITIYGINFGTPDTSLDVTFNSISAPILTRSNTALMVSVPHGAETGPLIVKADGISSTSNNIFWVGNVTSLPRPEEAYLSTIAGAGSHGLADGSGATARFNAPTGVTVDRMGNLFVADHWNACIRKITPDRVVTTFAGNGASGYDDGIASAASFSGPFGITVDINGNLYVAESYHAYTRKITQDGTVSKIVARDWSGSIVYFNGLTGIAVDANANLYIADKQRNLIRKISVDGVVSTIAGSGEQGFADGPAADAKFNWLQGIALDEAGNIFIADAGNNRIRKLSPTGMVSTIAGDGSRGFADGTGTAAKFNSPQGVTVDQWGNLFVTDTGNNFVRKITPSGAVTTIAEKGSQTAALFNSPIGITVDWQGAIYVTDRHRISKIEL